jgi:hypothetical protein
MDVSGECLLYYEIGIIVHLVFSRFQISQLVLVQRINHAVEYVLLAGDKKMTSAVDKSKWDEFYRNVFGWWNKRRNDQSANDDRAYERSISILQKRYGYTREEAASQLNKHYSKAWLG